MKNHSDEWVSVAVFTVSTSAQDPQVDADGNYLLSGKAFEVGSYPDKKFALSEPEADAACADFSTVPMNYEHVRGVLDGDLGEMRGMTRHGTSLLGKFSVPPWLVEKCRAKKTPLKVSLEWDRKTKRVLAGAWVLNPRIKDAELMAAFSHRHEGKPPERKTMASKLQEALKARGVEIDDDLHALFAEERDGEIAKEANAFAAEMQKNKKIVPAERERVAALFAQALRDDDENEAAVKFSLTDEKAKEGSRADLVRDLFAKRPAHTLTDETLATNDKATFALGNGSDAPGGANGGGMTEERRRELLSKTETGKAVLKSEEKK